MNFFEQELAKIFGAGDVIERPEFSGSCCIGSLGQDLRVKAEIAESFYSQNYDVLRLRIGGSFDCRIDSVELPFVDMLGFKPAPNSVDFPRGVKPYVYTDGVKTDWYEFKPQSEDYRAIRKAAASYLSCFQKQKNKELQPAPDNVKSAGGFFQGELYKLFADGAVMASQQFFGPFCMGSYGRNLLVRISIVENIYKGNYDALRFVLIHPDSGVVGMGKIYFNEILGDKALPASGSFPNGKAPYIWADSYGAEWYGVKPEAKDYAAIREAVAEYLRKFQELDIDNPFLVLPPEARQSKKSRQDRGR